MSLPKEFPTAYATMEIPSATPDSDAGTAPTMRIWVVASAIAVPIE